MVRLEIVGPCAWIGNICTVRCRAWWSGILELEQNVFLLSRLKLVLMFFELVMVRILSKCFDFL